MFTFLLYVPVLATGTLVLLGFGGLMLWGFSGLLHGLWMLSTTWVPVQPWSLWHASDPLAIWQHSLQALSPSLLAFRRAPSVERIFLGCAVLVSAMNVTFLAMVVSVGYVNALVSCVAVRRDPVQLLRSVAEQCLTIILVWLLVSILTPLSHLSLTSPRMDVCAFAMACLLSAFLLYRGRDVFRPSGLPPQFRPVLHRTSED